jgi:hypothetical protein
MTPYKNLSSKSGIESYELGNDRITVRFNDGWYYLYTNGSAGISDISQMKKLAVAGTGLNSFINKNVKYDYEKKWK